MVIALPGTPADAPLMAWEWAMSLVQRQRAEADTTVDTGTAPLWVLVLAGSAELTAAGRRTELLAGDAALVEVGTVHRLVARAGSELATGDLRSVLGTAGVPNPLVVRAFSQRHAALRQLVDTCPPGAACSNPIWTRAYANLFGAAMVTAWLDDDGAAIAADPAVAAVLTAIAEAPGEVWTLERMARIAHLSRSALTARFQAELGKAPSDVLRELRMNEARGMLAESKHPIGAVAFAVGYGSTAAFSRAFASHHGMAPQAWRERRA
ncbi:AraC family transcriptional regulator [Gryllotalpicola protaetiae]|uniref:AraC family transcriptional regulator n=1 Tax=Gryllotalpicola protaetiae TaxID=2419771 RepID=A0A387BMZ8_9MICO|nr:AraC family transcriptional regulator [Gryllotalpicola protaetiae]AYG03394.1 AraC family transcriptional regulator [Gryllotalpicola protaetiae]